MARRFPGLYDRDAILLRSARLTYLGKACAVRPDNRDSMFGDRVGSVDRDVLFDGESESGLLTAFDGVVVIANMLAGNRVLNNVKWTGLHDVWCLTWRFRCCSGGGGGGGELWGSGVEGKLECGCGGGSSAEFQRPFGLISPLLLRTVQ